MTRPLNPRFQVKYDHLAATAVTLAPILYFLPAVLQGRVLCPADGLIQNVPFRVAAAQMIRAGDFPLWNPYIFSGTPFMASAQVGLLYPLNWFYVFFSPIAATNLMVISSYMLAALGAYLFARRSGASILGAIITSLIWQWSGHLIGEIGHINIVQTAAMLPWILWSIEYFAAGATQRRAFLIAAFVAVQLFAGHHQMFVYSLLLVAAYALAMAIVNVEARKRYFASLAYIGGGILLAAVQILPTFELLRNSNRAVATYEFLTSFSMPRSFVALFVAPYVTGGGDGRLFRAPYIGPPYYPELVGYVGILGLMLAITALVIKRDGRTTFWAVVALIALLLAFGGHAPFGLYNAIYYVPLLNLFRVPARHLMEVDFALAVLAGRGITTLAALRNSPRVLLRVGIVTSVVCLLTFLTVTILRPSEFRLGREAPASLMRAPELFLPLVFAIVSASALWWFTRQGRGAGVLIVTVLAVDLVVWGQSSTWYTQSPKRDDPYWHVPETVQALREISPKSPYRILTAPHKFDPTVAPVPPSVSHSTDFVLWTHPDIYLMHGIQNAAGYDAFMLERYRNLAGNMKVWGELTDPNATLRGEGRNLDLLNVSHLLSMRAQSTAATPAADALTAAASQNMGDSMFAQTDFALPPLKAATRLEFSVPPVDIDRVALVSSLAWSENVPDGTVVARLRLVTVAGQTLELPLRAGVDTAEWAYDRPNALAHIRHKRATIATSYDVTDPAGNYQGHTFVTSVALPEQATISEGDIILEPQSVAPELSLSVLRLSLIDSSRGKTYALPPESVSIERPAAARWKLATQTRYVDIYQNTQVLPRAWLVSATRAMSETEILEVIRAGRFADGTEWDPAKTALVESAIGEKLGAANVSEATLTNYEPNRIVITTKSDADQILVLSENHYPGWRAYVDGRAVETLRVNYNLRGAIVPAGEHHFEFVYRPKSVFIGLLISLLGGLGLAFAGVIGKRIFRRRT